MKNVGAWMVAVAGAALFAVIAAGPIRPAQAAPSATDFTALESEIDSAIATFTAADLTAKNVKYFTDHLSQARKFVGMAASDVGGKKQKYSADFKHAQAQLKIVAHNLNTNRGRKIDATLKAQLTAVAQKLLMDLATLKSK